MSNSLYPLFPTEHHDTLDKLVQLSVDELEIAVASIINKKETNLSITRDEIIDAFYAQREKRRIKFENLIQLTRDISNIFIGRDQEHPQYVVIGKCLNHPDTVKPPTRQTKLSEVRELLYDLPERVVAHTLAPYCSVCANHTYPEKTVIQILPSEPKDIVFVNSRLKSLMSLSQKMALAITGGIDPLRNGNSYGINDEAGLAMVFSNQKRRDIAKKKLINTYNHQLHMPGTSNPFKTYKIGEKPWVGWKTFVNVGDVVELQGLAYGDLKKIAGQYFYGPIFEGEYTDEELNAGIKERLQKEERIFNSLTKDNQASAKRMAMALHFALVYVSIEDAKKNNSKLISTSDYLTKELLAAQKWAS